MTYRNPTEKSIQLAMDFHRPSDPRDELWHAEQLTSQELWADWEIRQALESGDVSRAADLAELKLSDNEPTWT